MYLEEDRDAEETAAFESRYGSAGRRMAALAWHGPESRAATGFAEGQLVAVRAACAEELGHPVGWDDPGSFRKNREGAYELPFRPWTVGGALAGAGCLAAALGFVAIWVIGLVALFD